MIDPEMIDPVKNEQQKSGFSPDKILVLGGIRSGKSVLAETLADRSKFQVVYLATAQAFDKEMQERIDTHVSRRPDNWINIEEPVALAEAMSGYNKPEYCILLDCLSGWVTNLLMTEDDQLMRDEISALNKFIDSCSSRLIFVSTESNLGIIPLGELTRRYCDEIGLLHQSLAQKFDSVILTVAGLPHYLKGDKLETLR